MATRVSELRNGAARAAEQPHADLDDRMLVLDFQAGNAEVFGEIHRRYSGLARHICQRILGNADDADEATQEAMLRVYQGLSRFNGRYALQPWVARIATNVSLDVTRARTRRPQTGDLTVFDLREELRGHGDDPVEALERGLEREQVNEVLGSLPEHHREALVLREIEGRSHKEIGEKLGVTPSQAKALIHRAKGSFRRAWENGRDRRGLAVLAPIFLAPLKVPQLFRRLMIPTHELAASATAAPAATTSVVTTGERITAAAVAVLVAGSAAVGAVALKRPALEPKPAESPSVRLVVPATKPEPALPIDRRKREGPSKPKLIPPAVVTPAATAPSESPVAGPSESPSSDPTSPPPPPPPAPAFGMSFRSDVSSGFFCTCEAGPTVTDAVTEGRAGETVSFTREAVTATRDAEGDLAWRTWTRLTGSAERASGDIELAFYLQTNTGWFQYAGSGTLASLIEEADGTFSYVYSGTYRLTGGPAPAEGMPQTGSFTATVHFWLDGTSLHAVEVALADQI